MKTKRYRILVLTAAVCVAGVWGVKAFAALTEKQLSLAELKAVYVFVQGLTEETIKRGLKAEQIKADVEKKLGQVGVEVVSEQESANQPGSPTLYVNISAYKRERAPVYVYHIDVGLMQSVVLERDEQIRIMSITWMKGRLVGYCPSKELVKSVNETIEYLMDRFIEDYKAANPK